MTAESRSQCPHCRSTELAPWRRRADAREVWACRSCALRFVREGFDDLDGLYGPDYFDKRSPEPNPAFGYSAYGDVMPIDFRWHMALMRLFAEGAHSLVDVGCATGRFLAAARAGGFEGRGVELSAYARERAQALGFEVSPSMAALSPSSGGGRADVVTMWEVIEHVTDLRASLVAARDALTDGGLFMLSTPDTDAPAVLAYGDEWIGLRTSLEHLTYLNRAFLAPLLREVFECEPLFVTAGAEQYWTLVAIARKGGLRASDLDAHRRLVARAPEREVAWFWFSLEDVIAAQATIASLRATGADVALFEAILALRRAEPEEAYGRLSRLVETSGWAGEELQWLARAATAYVKSREPLAQQNALLFDRLDSTAESRAVALKELDLLRNSAGYRIGRSITRVLERLPYAEGVWRRLDELDSVGIRGAVQARLPKVKSLIRTLRGRIGPAASRHAATIARSANGQFTAVEVGLTRDLVSIVLPVFNHATLLREAIDSVLAQTYPRFELIVVNDGSSDGIEAVLSRYVRHPKVRILTQAHQGLPQALSAGFEVAQGELWTWTSADNAMEPVQLERMIAFMRSKPEVDMTYADYVAIDETGHVLRDPRFRPQNRRPPTDPEIHLPRDVSTLNTTEDNFIGPCFLYRGHVGVAVGDYDPAMGVEDFDYWMRINALFRIEHLGTDEILYRYRVHSNSLNARARELKIAERVSALMAYEAARGEAYRAPFVVVADGASGALAPQLAIAPRAALTGAGKRVRLLAGDGGPPSDEPGREPAVIWFGRDSVAPYRWAQWLERPHVVAIAPDARTVSRIAAAGGRGFSHEELGRAFDVALAALDATQYFNATKPEAVRARAVPELFRGSRPAPKVVLEVQSFDKGGLEQVVIDLAVVLRASGALPIIVATGPTGTAARAAERAGITVVELPSEDRAQAYAELLAREQVALVNAHYSLVGAPIAARANIPFVQTIHNSYVWLDDAERRAYAEADAFTRAYVCVSMTAASFADAALGLPASKIVVLPNGIDTAAFQPAASTGERDRLRAKHGVAVDAFVFLNVAGLRDWKGQRQLILAFPEVLRRAPHARLLIAGTGDADYRATLVDAIERNGLGEVVRLVGHTQSVAELYALSDAFVLPSFFEGASLALLEAACSGLPCVATDCGAAREVLALTTGELVPLPFESLVEHDLYSLQRFVDADEPLRSRLVDALLRVIASPRPARMTPELRRRFDRAETYGRHRDLFDWLIASGAPLAARRWLRARTEAAMMSERLRAGEHRVTTA